jgi:hypothetical protein
MHFNRAAVSGDRNLMRKEARTIRKYKELVQ